MNTLVITGHLERLAAYDTTDADPLLYFALNIAPGYEAGIAAGSDVGKLVERLSVWAWSWANPVVKIYDQSGVFLADATSASGTLAAVPAAPTGLGDYTAMLTAKISQLATGKLTNLEIHNSVTLENEPNHPDGVVPHLLFHETQRPAPLPQCCRLVHYFGIRKSALTMAHSQISTGIVAFITCADLGTPSQAPMPDAHTPSLSVPYQNGTLSTADFTLAIKSTVNTCDVQPLVLPDFDLTTLWVDPGVNGLVNPSFTDWFARLQVQVPALFDLPQRIIDYVRSNIHDVTLIPAWRDRFFASLVETANVGLGAGPDNFCFANHLFASVGLSPSAQAANLLALTNGQRVAYGQNLNGWKQVLDAWLVGLGYDKFTIPASPAQELQAWETLQSRLAAANPLRDLVKTFWSGILGGNFTQDMSNAFSGDVTIRPYFLNAAVQKVWKNLISDLTPIQVSNANPICQQAATRLSDYYCDWATGGDAFGATHTPDPSFIIFLQTVGKEFFLGLLPNNALSPIKALFQKIERTPSGITIHIAKPQVEDGSADVRASLAGIAALIRPTGTPDSAWRLLNYADAWCTVRDAAGVASQKLVASSVVVPRPLLTRNQIRSATITYNNQGLSGKSPLASQAAEEQMKNKVARPSDFPPLPGLTLKDDILPPALDTVSLEQDKTNKWHLLVYGQKYDAAVFLMLNSGVGPKELSKGSVPGTIKLPATVPPSKIFTIPYLRLAPISSPGVVFGPDNPPADPSAPASDYDALPPAIPNGVASLAREYESGLAVLNGELSPQGSVQRKRPLIFVNDSNFVIKVNPTPIDFEAWYRHPKDLLQPQADAAGHTVNDLRRILRGGRLRVLDETMTSATPPQKTDIHPIDPAVEAETTVELFSLSDGHRVSSNLLPTGGAIVLCAPNVATPAQTANLLPLPLIEGQTYELRVSSGIAKAVFTRIFDPLFSSIGDDDPTNPAHLLFAPVRCLVECPTRTMPSETELYNALSVVYENGKVQLLYKYDATTNARYLTRATIYRQPWRWDGRPLPVHDLVTGLVNGIPLDQNEAILDFEAATYGLRDENQSSSTEVDLASAPRIATDSNGNQVNQIVLYSEDVSSTVAAQYFRFKTVFHSRYETAYSDLSPRTARGPGATDSCQWKRVFVPCRTSGTLPKLPVRMIIPLASNQLLLVLMERWSDVAGLAEAVQAQVVTNTDGKGSGSIYLEMGPDPTINVDKQIDPDKPHLTISIGAFDPNDPDDEGDGVPFGHTHDTTAVGDPLFTASSYVITARPNSHYPTTDPTWWMAKLQFRRRTRAQLSKPTYEVYSEWTETSWVQFLPDSEKLKNPNLEGKTPGWARDSATNWKASLDGAPVAIENALGWLPPGLDSFCTILIGTRRVTDAAGKPGELFHNFYLATSLGSYQPLLSLTNPDPVTGDTYFLRVALIHGNGSAGEGVAALLRSKAGSGDPNLLFNLFFPPKLDQETKSNPKNINLRFAAISPRIDSKIP